MAISESLTDISDLKKGDTFVLSIISASDTYNIFKGISRKGHIKVEVIEFSTGKKIFNDSYDKNITSVRRVIL